MKLFNKNLLEISSLIFLTNFLHNTWHREYPYAWLFLLLTISSVFIHSGVFNDIKPQLKIVDNFIIFSIFIYGYLLFWKISKNNKSSSFIPITSFLTVCYMYGVGYFQNKYSFDPNPNIAHISHAVIHLLGCLGHHIIIYENRKK